MRKRGPNDDEMLTAILAGLPDETLAELLDMDGVVATAVGSDDLDGVVEDSDKLRRELGLTRRKNK